MWNPFKKAQEEKARADALAEKLNRLLEKEEARAAEERAKKEEEEKLERLIQEQKNREDAAKNLATKNGKPYIAIKQFEVDGAKVTEGEVELDWNSIFVDDLKKNGYVGQTDEDVVDQWFRDICRHIVLETFEQADANIGHKPTKEDLGSGRTGYS